MIRWLISVAVHLAANAIALLVADLILDDFSISLNGFLVAVLIFTGVEVLVEPMFQKMTLRSASALQGGVALIATLVGLIVTDLISDSVSIEGVSTWIAATVVVWLGGVLAIWILGIIFIKNRVDDRQDRRN
jgi:uncharacterized membrane protein YvlD (DUF360 family)